MPVDKYPDSRRVRIFDTTLRDGEQAPGNAMSPDQKVKIALGLEAVGVDTIEAGFTTSSPSDYKAIELISSALTTARFASLNRAIRSDIEASASAGGVEQHQLEIMATGSDVHLRHKRGISRTEGISEVVDSIRFAASLGFTDISLAVEDASRGTDDLLRPLISAAVDGGARTIVLADTTGCLVPTQYFDLLARARSWVSDDIVLATHCHDDLGLSLANALAAVEAGADEVQTTLAGIGERAGNTSLEELIAVLVYRGDQLGLRTTAKTEGLYGLYQLMAGFIGLPPQRNKAIFGTNAFATQAGIHQAGMLRDPVTYESVAPGRFGRERSILVGRHSGRSVIKHLFDKLGIEPDRVAVNALYEEYITSRSNGECIDLDVLCQVLASRMGLETAAKVSRTIR